MRILIISDIHSNWPALQAIQEPWDVCLCLGDIVEYGPEPGPCIDWVRRNTQYCVRGNHDHGAVQDVSVFGISGFRYLTMATRRSTVKYLQAEPQDRRFLADLPLMQMVTLDGMRFLLVHASPRDPLEEYVPGEVDAWATRLTHIKADFVLAGHTHNQYHLAVGKTEVINPGSVGLPRFGDPRVRYALIDNGMVHLRQIEYDIAATLQALEESDFETLAKERLSRVYVDGKYPPPTQNGNGHHNGNGNGHASKGSLTGEHTAIR